MAHQVGMPAPNFHNHESSFKSQDCLTYHEFFVFFFLMCICLINVFLMDLLIPELCFALKHVFSAVSGFGDAFFSLI